MTSATRRRYGLPPGVQKRTDTGRFRFRFTDTTGRRVSVELSATDTDGVWREWNRYQTLRDQGRGVDPSWTVASWRVVWLETRRSVEAKTAYGDELLTAVLADTYGHLRLTDLTGAHLDNIYNALRDRGLSDQTVFNHHAAFRKMLRAAVRKRIIPWSPHTDAEPPATPKRTEKPVWDAAQTDTFLTSAVDDTFYPLFRIALETGMRRGEVAGLRWRDVGDTALTVNSRLTVVHGHATRLPSTKTGRARVVAVSDGLRKVLWKQKVFQRETLFACGIRQTGDTPVVANDRGRPYSPTWLTRRWAQAVAASGVEPAISFGQARHTYATLALAAGIPIQVVADRLGNSPDVILRHYAQVSTEARRAAANVVNYDGGVR